METKKHSKSTTEKGYLVPERGVIATEDGIGECFSVYASDFDSATWARFCILVDSKEVLIKKAFAIRSFPMKFNGERINFYWFTRKLSEAEKKAYKQFFSAFCSMAKAQKRPAERSRAENKRSAFYDFLLRLGFGGPEYKETRRILMRGFTKHTAE